MIHQQPPIVTWRHEEMEVIAQYMTGQLNKFWEGRYDVFPALF